MVKTKGNPGVSRVGVVTRVKVSVRPGTIVGGGEVGVVAVGVTVTSGVGVETGGSVSAAGIVTGGSSIISGDVVSGKTDGVAVGSSVRAWRGSSVTPPAAKTTCPALASWGKIRETATNTFRAC
jgi:hypothetical protein